MRYIYLLCDYKGHFGYKYGAEPYRSGMNKDLLRKFFHDNGYTPKFLNFHQIDFRKNSFRNQLVLYTSYEDMDNYYKSFVEDVIYAIQMQEGILIPRYEFLRCHNNKVFMELLRDLLNTPIINNIKSHCYGTFEELLQDSEKYNGRYILKSAVGAKSKNVYRATNIKQILNIARKIARKHDLKMELWEVLRSLRYKNYQKESKYRKKFLIQNYIDGLDRDYKVLVFGKKYYVLERKIKKDDFRASGSGIFSYPTDVDSVILDFSCSLYNLFDVPNIAFDIGYNKKECFLFEFQALMFGTYTVENAQFFYHKTDQNWSLVNEQSILEKEYVISICDYIRSKGY